MYVPPVFTEDDESEIAAFVDRHPLATLVRVENGGIVVDHIPFVREGRLCPSGRMIAHIARANPGARFAGSKTDAVLVFTGASAYVSPSFYPSKKTTHEVVPTWNYVSVHLRGVLTVSDDDDEKRRAVDILTRKMEAPRPEPWSVSDAPDAYIERMLRGILALRFDVGSVEAKIKASQNRTGEDRLGVVSALSENAETEQAARAAERFLTPAR
jgi:transcriptional regulator